MFKIRLLDRITLLKYWIKLSLWTINKQCKKFHLFKRNKQGKVIKWSGIIQVKYSSIK